MVSHGLGEAMHNPSPERADCATPRAARQSKPPGYPRWRKVPDTTNTPRRLDASSVAESRRRRRLTPAEREAAIVLAIGCALLLILAAVLLAAHVAGGAA